MHLLVLSHPAVLPVAQEFYVAIERHSRWRLTIVVPANWRSEYGHHVRVQRSPSLAADLIEVTTLLPGNIPLHVYGSTLLATLHRVRPDAIYVHHEPYGAATAQMYLANRLWKRVPIGFYSAQNIGKRYPAPFRQLERWVYRHSSYAFPISEDVAGVLRSKGYRGPATILPLGVDDRANAPGRRSRPLRRTLGVGGDEPVIGFVGRLVAEKGVRTLLNAAARIADLPWRLVIVGSGPLEAELQSLAEALGIGTRVTFVGFVPHADTPRYLASMDVLVLPSETRPHWREQFGRVITEALACGTAVLGSDSGEIPHLIRATGGGLTFHEGDAPACARQLRVLVQDAVLRGRLRDSGRAVVMSRYTHDALAPHFIDTIAAATSATRAVA